jgi:hypothetical protein
MWLYGLGDDQVEMEDIGRCFINFPQFRHDFTLLIHEGVITHNAFDQYQWTKSKTSLAEYFKWIAAPDQYVPGGFWSEIEPLFGIKRGTLRRLASHNANYLKPPESRDFIKIKASLQQYRTGIKQQQKEKDDFNAIKKLVAVVEDDNPEKMHKVLLEIKKLFA